MRTTHDAWLEDIGGQHFTNALLLTSKVWIRKRLFIIQKCYLNFTDLNSFSLRVDVKLLNLITLLSVARFDIQLDYEQSPIFPQG